jgi:simple sugar transport system permease protein
MASDVSGKDAFSKVGRIIPMLRLGDRFDTGSIIQESIVPVFFLLLSAAAYYYAGLSSSFVAGEVITRLARDSILVAALVIPIIAGLGINFAIVLGAIAGQIGYIFVLDHRIYGFEGLLIAVAIAIPIGIAMGYITSLCLNRARGKEMIASIMLAFLANGIYQMIFMVGYGTLFPSNNKEMLLSRGIGLRDTIDLAGIRGVLDKAIPLSIGGVEIPALTLLVALFVISIAGYILITPLGQRFRAVGENSEIANMAGIDVRRIRMYAIVISTVLAAIGQVIFLQNIGIFNTYTAHRNAGFIASAALLAGGATVRNAKIRNVLLGTVLFHTLFVLSPQAGQNFTGSAVIGEYFRSFVMYGTICIALAITNRKTSRQSTS